MAHEDRCARHVEMAGRPGEEMSPNLQLCPVAQLLIGWIGGLYPVFPGPDTKVLEGNVRVDVLGRVVHRHSGDLVHQVLGAAAFLINVV